MPYQVLLYYKFVPIENHIEVASEHRVVLERFHLLGRVLIAPEGINATISGLEKDTDKYIAYMNKHPLFKDIHYKIDPSDRHQFHKLIVRAKNQLVAFSEHRSIDPNKETGKYLSPDDFHQMASMNDVVLFDGRNNYESKIGKMKQAINSGVNNSKDFERIIKNQHEKLNGKKIITYCTGGIRCEKISAMLLRAGHKDVYQLQGGIVSYAKKYPKGHFIGSCYVFDNRVKVKFDPSTRIISKCVHCKARSDEYRNCSFAKCNKQIIICQRCFDFKKHCRKCWRNKSPIERVKGK